VLDHLNEPSRALLHLLAASPEESDWCHENSRIRPSLERSAFAGVCFPPEVIVLSVRWCLRFGRSYRDVGSCWPSGVSRWTT
jgi:hypothetical protein